MYQWFRDVIPAAVSCCRYGWSFAEAGDVKIQSDRDYWGLVHDLS